MVLAGISGPITIAGTAVMEMTESLAGIVLAQLVNAGVPCVCGGTSCAGDLRTGGVYLGGPELLQLMAISTQMARHYSIPCRYGGNLTDSFSLNMQAGSESALALSTGLLSGVHFVHQACGILGAYSAISFEKFVLDEEACGLMKRALSPVDISEESIGLDLIERVGSSGNYMMTDETVMGCRTAFFFFFFAQKGTYEEWCKEDLGNTAWIAAKHVEERLEAYVKPDNDPTMEKDIERYVAAKLNG